MSCFSYKWELAKVNVHNIANINVDVVDFPLVFKLVSN